MIDPASAAPPRAGPAAAGEEPGVAARTLRAAAIVRTLHRLEERVHDRFPGRGLDRLCTELVAVARETERRVERARRPNPWLRGAVALVLLGAVGLAWQLALLMGPSVVEYFGRSAERGRGATPGELMQTFESAVNLVVLASLAIWFLLSLDRRYTRHRVQRHLHELRSIAHVVDMHQLTKDPVSILNPDLRMASSPVRDLTPGQLARYLDYCVEMLSLIGKLAALYGEHSDDPMVIAGANDIEDLTTNLSRKIWQKIMLTGAALDAE